MNISIHVDIHMNIDIRIIIDMNIEDYIRYYLSSIRHSLLAVPYWLLPIAGEPPHTIIFQHASKRPQAPALDRHGRHLQHRLRKQQRQVIYYI